MPTRDDRERIRDILSGSRVVTPASVFDALSVRMAADIGFECAVIAGSTASFVELGAPDLRLLTATELAERVGKIARAAALPLLVDADHGYGDTLNVHRTVAELERSGAAAVSIEDTMRPPGFGDAAPDYFGLAEMSARLRAALDARTDPGLVILGRTSTGAHVGVEAAVERCRMFEAEGVDALFLAGGIGTRADFERIAAATRLPIVLGRAEGEVDDPGFLADMRVRMLLKGHLPLQEAMRALYRCYAQIRGVPVPGEVEALTGAAFMAMISNRDEHERRLASYYGFDPRP